VCNIDQKSFTAYLSRFMALTATMASFAKDFTMEKLRTSANAAARHCSFGEDRNTYGMKWSLNGEWDNSCGVGMQFSALETVQSNLIAHIAAPVTHNTGGTIKENPAAEGDTADEYIRELAVTTRDCVSAGLLTTCMLLLLIGTTVWMMTE
jgi:mannan endo-1,6-alpha-mannosidase